MAKDVSQGLRLDDLSDAEIERIESRYSARAARPRR
jgi:hypothetical protein